MAYDNENYHMTMMSLLTNGPHCLFVTEHNLLILKFERKESEALQEFKIAHNSELVPMLLKMSSTTCLQSSSMDTSVKPRLSSQIIASLSPLLPLLEVVLSHETMLSSLL
jgi:hypothetical protein